MHRQQEEEERKPLLFTEYAWLLWQRVGWTEFPFIFLSWRGIVLYLTNHIVFIVECDYKLKLLYFIVTLYIFMF